MNSINLSQFEGIDSDHYENFPILYDSQIPSILLELGYLSNSEDYTKLTDETFQQKDCECDHRKLFRSNQLTLFGVFFCILSN